MGRGKHNGVPKCVPKTQCSMRLPEYVRESLKELGEGKGMTTGCMKLHAWWTVHGSEEIAHLKTLIAQPPVCKICGTPMQAVVSPMRGNLNGTAFMQETMWTCPNCYDVYEVDCCFPEI